MTRDIDTLLTWTRVCLWIAAICATSFPALYAFSPWYRSRLGRALMLQSIAFALALDITVLFQYWHIEDVLVIFWINAVVFAIIAVATTTLTGMLWHINYKTKYEKRVRQDGTRSTD